MLTTRRCHVWASCHLAQVEILNQRLGVLKDLYDLLQNTLNATRPTRHPSDRCVDLRMTWRVPFLEAC